MTPGRQKFYSTMHLVAIPYMDPDNLQPTADPKSELGKLNRENFFRMQENYFGLPREQRLPYLHSCYELQYGKVLSPEQRAATDALVLSRAAREESAQNHAKKAPGSAEPAAEVLVD